MKWLALLLMCSALSGCGLFRNLKKDRHESVETTRVTSTAKNDRDVGVSVGSSTTDRSKSRTSSSEQVTVYPRKGSEVTVNPDGSITTEADSVKRSIDRLTSEAKDIASYLSSTLSLSAMDSAATDSTKTKSDITASTDSEPSWKPYLWGLAVIALLAIIYAVYRKFRVF